MRAHPVFAVVFVLLAAILVIAALVISPEIARPTASMMQSGDCLHSLTVGGLERRFTVHVPPSYDGKRRFPVVVMLHGGGGNSQAAATETGWGAKADRAEFLVVFPNALARDPTKPGSFAANPQLWNDGSERFYSGQNEVDDVEFLNKMLDEVLAKYSADDRRIFVTGFSNGASMCFRFGAAACARVAAIAPVAGACWLDIKTTARPIPMLYITGDADPLNPIEGGVPKLATGNFDAVRAKAKPPVRDSILKWAKAAGCPTIPTSTSESGGVRTDTYGPSLDGTEVICLTVKGLGHTSAGGRSLLPEFMVGRQSDKISATDVIWEFFQKHPLGAVGSGGVPAAYLRLYNALSAGLDAFERDHLRGRASERQPVWGAQLLAANANRGEELLRPTAIAGVRLFLDRFQELGIRGVTVAVSFPLLDPAFPRAADYAKFFHEVAAEVRSRGMALEVETGVLFAGTAFSTVHYDFSKMTFADLVARRKAHVAAVVRQMAPDWLDIGAEPGTESRLSGLRELNDPEKRTAMLRTILDGLDRGKTKMAAGIGTWDDLRFVENALAETSLDAVAVHIYPIGPQHFEKVAAVTRLAQKKGKEVLLDEVWLYKTAGTEEVTDIASNERIFKRDLWSFWAPLDQRFLRDLDTFCRLEGVAYVSPFWSHLFFACLEYDPAHEALDYRTLNATYLERVRTAVQSGAYSPTGNALKALIAAHGREDQP